MIIEQARESDEVQSVIDQKPPTVPPDDIRIHYRVFLRTVRNAGIDMNRTMMGTGVLTNHL